MSKGGEGMDKILLNDLLEFKQEEFGNIKIKFNQWNGYNDPIELYQINPEMVNNQWLFWRGETRNFTVGQTAICLLKLNKDSWLLTTIKKVTKELDVCGGINYEGEELVKYKPYYGRVIVKYHKTSQQQCRKYEGINNELEVQQILPAIFDGDDFPGYDEVRVSYSQLKLVVKSGKRDWIAALKNQKAVYLITDKNNGKLYVGSATSDNGMLLQRWENYINNGHGGNNELKKVAEEKGFDYIKDNFQYSILENYNAKVDDHVILERESWWKEALQSKCFGYNNN